MLKQKALEFYDGNASQMARAIGVSRAAVSKWGEVIPYLSARKLKLITRGKLKIQETRYDAEGQPIE